MIRRGFNDIRNEIIGYLEKLSSHNSEDNDKKTFYESLLVVIDAVVSFSKRHAKKLMELASDEKESGRKEELILLAEICEKVPA